MLDPQIPIERERRWLLTAFDSSILDEGFPQKEIMQAYFDVLGERSFRTRIIDGKRAVVTLKEGSGEIRTERELDVDLAVAKLMFEAASYRISKTRHEIGEWELDIFHGELEGIVLIEYEAKGDSPIPQLPCWIQAKDATDVTDSLTNLHLARMAKEISGDANEHVARYLEPKLPKIVLTGGPCSGKSTLMREVQEKYGDVVHCVSEVASILITQVGLRPDPRDPVMFAKFQRVLYRTQRSFEEAAELQAIKDGKKALVLDRGTLDAVAYFDGDFNELRQTQFKLATGVSVLHELERYERVLFLAPPSASVFEEHSKNNPARTETYEQAKKLAERTHEAWTHNDASPLVRHRLKTIDGDTWEAKSQAALSHISWYTPLNP